MSTSQLFFHYTSTAGANGIRHDGILRSQNGVMLSSLKPEDHTRDDILHSIHGNTIPTEFKNRADNVVVVDGSNLDSSKLSQIKPNLWKYSGDIKISPTNVKDKPACTNRGGSSWGTSTQSLTNDNTTGSSGLSGGKQTVLNGQIFYHYTSTAGANGIRKDEILRSNNGVMLSSLKPEDHTRDDILHSIHGNTIPTEFKNRADNIVVVKGSTLDSSKLSQIKPNLWKYLGDIRISASDVKDKPACTNRSGNSWKASTWGSNSNTGSSSAQQTFYYYIDKRTATQIKSSGRTASNCRVVLTTMKPENYFRDQILEMLHGKSYDRNLYAHWADYCAKIDASKLDPTKLNKIREKVYEYSDSVNFNSNDVIDKPECIFGQSSTPGGQNDLLYHYTNKKGADAIKQTGYLKKSGTSGAFGAGVYMTSLRPNDFFREDILKNNYGGINAAFKGRADWVVQVNRHNLDQSKLKEYGANVTNDGNRKIFVYEDEIKVNSNDVFDKPKCFRAK